MALRGPGSRDGEGAGTSVAGRRSGALARVRAGGRAAQRLQALQDASPAGIVEMDLEHRIRSCNRAFARMVGEPQHALAGRPGWEFLHPAGPGPDVAAFEALLAGRTDSHSAEQLLRGPDGSPLAVRLDFAVVRRKRQPAGLLCVVTDISAYVAVTAELTKRQMFTDTLLETVDVGIARCDANGGNLIRNRAHREMFGLPPHLHDADQAVTAPLIEVRDADGALVEAPQFPIHRALRGEIVDGTEFRVGPAGAPLRDVLMRASRIAGPDGRTMGAVVAISDVSAERAAQREALEAKALFEAILTASPDYTFVTDIRTGAVVYGSPGKRVLGLATEDLIRLGAEGARRLVHPDDRAGLARANREARTLPDGGVVTIRHRIRHADGGWRWCDRRVTPFRRDPATGEVVEVLGVVRDVSDLVEAEERLTHTALHDPLTGLPNRALLIDRLEAALARASDAGGQVAVLFCDLDGFKGVNDAAGHAGGDAVLVEAARRITGALREHDTVARVGGDEFVVVVEPWQRLERARGLAEAEALAVGLALRVTRALRRPVRVGDATYALSASVGVAFAGPACAARTADEVLRDADAAMYRAKHEGKDQVQVSGRSGAGPGATSASPS